MATPMKQFFFEKKIHHLVAIQNKFSTFDQAFETKKKRNHHLPS